MNKGKELLVTLKVDIEPEALKRVVKEGRLSEFVSAFPAMAAGHLKGQIVEQIATGEYGEVTIRYDDDYGTPPQPRPLPFIDTVPLPESAWGLRRIVREELGQGG